MPDIMEHTNLAEPVIRGCANHRIWNIAGRMVTGSAAQAQDDICRQAERYTRLAGRVSATLEKQPRVPFSWIRDRKA
jgi:acyl-[acyl-carrier-protein] desaturase